MIQDLSVLVDDGDPERKTLPAELSQIASRHAAPQAERLCYFSPGHRVAHVAKSKVS
jgi:hypothetical protein